jgi:DNA-binding beta-propeller fold protein YncE
MVIAISPDGKTAWVASINNNNAGLLTPISIATNTAGKPIRVGAGPVCLLITTGGPSDGPRKGSCGFVAR